MPVMAADPNGARLKHSQLALFHFKDWSQLTIPPCDLKLKESTRPEKQSPLPQEPKPNPYALTEPHESGPPSTDGTRTLYEGKQAARRATPLAITSAQCTAKNRPLSGIFITITPQSRPHVSQDFTNWCR